MPEEEMKHHPFGPSSFERRELCPGSYRMEMDLPSVESPDAQEGTRKHEEIAKAIDAFYHGEGVTIDIADDDVKAAMEKVVEIVSGNGDDVRTEYRLSYSYCGIEKYRGTADVVVVAPEKVIIIDFKFGHRAVNDAADNPQGALYALAAMQEFRKDVADVHFINPVIHQYSSHTFNDKSKIAAYAARVMAACMKEDAPLVPGETQCRYCKAAAHGTCPAIAKTAEVVAVKAEMLVPMPSLADLPAETLVELKRKCDLVAKLGERVDNRIKAICEESGSCGPYRLKESSGGREIKNIQAAFEKSGMDAATFLNCCTASVSKLEKAYAKELKESGVFKTEKEGKEKFNVELSELITSKPPKKQLVAV